ncbi:type II secretion system protein GspM [Sphingomonas sp. QA11]|uniref:type II secretion system protein GspM n=1 Tax=Sphingomonas sp. QA11 TaxID=2950605 RepID=UPI00234A789F|nr:type II secretion system protein GspM [Sphingomonas sp. QA11]WCM28035.1 type II secretion system protein GspM [Sphingomonas sp. QA11]
MALLILTALVALVHLAIVSPIVGGFATRTERREALTLRYAHNLRTIGSIPRLRRRAEQQRDSIGAFVIEARNVEAGREVLKERLQHTIEHAGGEFREGGDGEGQPGWARARASARMTLPQLTATLDQLQNSSPWLVIETLSVAANDALVTGQSSTMDVQIEVSVPLRPATVR